MSMYHMDTNIYGGSVGSVGPGGHTTITNISSSRSSQHDNVKRVKRVNVSELGHLVTKKKNNLVKSKIMKGKTHFYS